MSPEATTRKRNRQLQQPRAPRTTRTANRITIPTTTGSTMQASGPMVARMGGNKLVSARARNGNIPGGRMTTRDRLFLEMRRLKAMQTQSERKEAAARRRHAFGGPAGMGMHKLEMFAEHSELIRNTQHASVRKLPVRSVREKPQTRSTRRPEAGYGHLIAADGNVNTPEQTDDPRRGPRTRTSGYGALTGNRTAGIEPPTNAERKRRLDSPSSPSSAKRRKGKENAHPMATDVIDVVVLSDSAQSPLRNKRFSRLKKSRKHSLVPVPANDSVFDSQVGGSPIQSSHKACLSKRGVKASARHSRRAIKDVTEEMDFDFPVKVVSSCPDEKANIVKLRRMSKASPRSGTEAPVDLTSSKRDRVDAAHTRTSPMPNDLMDNSNDVRPVSQPLTPLRSGKTSVLALTTSQSSSQRKDKSQPRRTERGKQRSRKIGIELNLNPIRGYPPDLKEDERTNEESDEVVDVTDRVDVVKTSPRRTSREKGKNKKKPASEGPISPNTFYAGGTQSKSGNQGRVNGSIGSSLKPRPRRSMRRKKSFECSVDEMEDKTAKDIRFRGLSTGELNELSSIMHRDRKTQVIASIKAANIELRGEDFNRLRGSRWLSDELINSFIALINARNAKYFEDSDVTAYASKLSISEKSRAHASGTATDPGTHASFDSGSEVTQDFFSRPRPRVHVFNTFFFARLTQGKGYDYQGVQRWLKRAGKRVEELDLIMFPINISNLHWVLGAIDLRGRKLLYFDSTYGSDSLGALETLRQWLKDEVMDKCGEVVLDRMDIDSWNSTVNPQYLPEQQDDGSCGIFTLYMAEYMERGLRPNFKQDHIRTLRRRTALFLHQGALPPS